MMIIIYLLCLILLLYYFLRKNYSYWESKGVPFEKPFLIFGSFYNIATRKEHIFQRFRSIYNQFKTPYVGIYIFNQPALVVRSPELIKKILVKDFDKFINRNFASDESVDPLASNTLFSAKNAHWRNIRSKLSPVFTSGKMKLMFPLMKECAENLNSYLEKQNGRNVETRNATKKYSVDIISSCAFGINANCLKNKDSEIMDMATRLLDFKSLLRGFSVFCFFFAPKLVTIFKLTFADKTASDYLFNVFKSAFKEREKMKVVRNDLIDLLHNIKKNEAVNDFKFDDMVMAAQAISFFSAGNDTTSITVSFTLYELALNKDIQDRLRQEVKETINAEGGITYESIQSMKYLDMVLNEALRKYPLTTFLNRKSTADYTFEETGFTLEKDTSVLIPVAGLHYDPDYFPDPEKFDPDRFSDKNKNNIKPYTFMPFGEGPRNCIGQRFGLLASKVAIAYVIKDFEFEATKETDIPLKFDPGSLFLQNKSGVILKVIKI